MRKYMNGASPFMSCFCISYIIYLRRMFKAYPSFEEKENFSDHTKKATFCQPPSNTNWDAELVS